MKFFHISDLHIGKNVNGYSMIEDQKYIFQQLFAAIDTHQPDALLIAGDVYDKAVPSAEAVHLFDELLNGLVDRQIPTIINSGNHDSAERLAFGSNIMKKQYIHISPVFDNHLEPVILTDAYGPVYIYMLPFIKPVQVKQYYPDRAINSYNEAIQAVLADVPIDTSKRNIILVHQFVVGAGLDPETSDSEENYVGATGNVSVSLFDGFDYVAMGHLHKPQSIGRPTARYSGSILKYSFSEANDHKSITVVEVGRKHLLSPSPSPSIGEDSSSLMTDIQVETLDLTPLRDMVELRGTYAELMDSKMYENLKRDDYYHITLTDEEEIPYVVAKLRHVYPNSMKVEYDNSRTRGHSPTSTLVDMEDKSPMEIIGDFYQWRTKTGLEQKQKDYVQEIVEEIWG